MPRSLKLITLPNKQKYKRINPYYSYILLKENWNLMSNCGEFRNEIVCTYVLTTYFHFSIFQVNDVHKYEWYYISTSISLTMQCYSVVMKFMSIYYFKYIFMLFDVTKIVCLRISQYQFPFIYI